MTDTVYELVEYRFRDGIDVNEAFSAFDKAVDDFCRAQPGFLERVVLEKDGLYLDMGKWASQADVEAANKLWPESEACKLAGETISDDSVKMSHMSQRV